MDGVSPGNGWNVLQLDKMNAFQGRISGAIRPQKEVLDGHFRRIGRS
jgi:hypothetical protein